MLGGYIYEVTTYLLRTRNAVQTWAGVSMALSRMNWITSINFYFSDCFWGPRPVMLQLRVGGRPRRTVGGSRAVADNKVDPGQLAGFGIGGRGAAVGRLTICFWRTHQSASRTAAVSPRQAGDKPARALSRAALVGPLLLSHDEFPGRLFRSIRLWRPLTTTQSLQRITAPMNKVAAPGCKDDTGRDLEWLRWPVPRHPVHSCAPSLMVGASAVSRLNIYSLVSTCGDLGE